MILSKKDLKYYIQQDLLMNGKQNLSFRRQLLFVFFPDYTILFLRTLRKTEYYYNCKTNKIITSICYYIYRIRLRRLGLKLGYSIPINVFGPGLSLPHYGTIIVNPNAHVGANCRLHACVNIGASGGDTNAPQIGDNVYIGPSAILFGNIRIADNVTIGANATVNKSCDKTNVALAGSPAKIVKEDYPSWVEFNKVKV